MGSVRTLEKAAGTAPKFASNALSGLFSLGRPLVMGILNVTPDSFSDGGQFLDPAAAIAHAAEMAQQGADILDIGAESTRPYGGAVPVSAADEKTRLAPILPEVIKLSLPLSIDTIKASIAAWALDQGATIVNDVWGLQRDPDMAPLVAKRGVPVIVMHNREAADASIDIVADVLAFFTRSLEIADRAGDHCARSRHRLRQDSGAKHHLPRAAYRVQALRLAASGRRIAQTFHQHRDTVGTGRAYRRFDCRPPSGGPERCGDCARP
jgi:hypothetical protein